MKLKNKLKTVCNVQIWSFWLFIIVVCISLFFSIFYSIKESNYLYDSFAYWTEGLNTMVSGNFSIFDFPKTFRGCLFPLSIFMFRRVLPGEWAWRVQSAITCGILFSILLPTVFSQYSKKYSLSKCIRILICFLLFEWIWGDYLQYPLADVTAVTIFIVAIVLSKKVLISKNSKESLVYAFLFGMAEYCAYNIRTAFGVGAIILLLILIVRMSSMNRKLLIFTCLIAMIGGMVAAIPQMMVNCSNLNKFTPLIYTNPDNEDHHRKTTDEQMYLGIAYSRCEGYVGFTQDCDYDSPLVFYEDKVGMKLLDDNNITLDSIDSKDVISLFRTNFLDITGVYFRNVISAMTPIFGQTYISNIHKIEISMMIISIILWIVFYSMLPQIASEGYLLELIPIALVSLIQCAGAVEIRFFIGMYLLCYFYLFVVMDFKNLLAKVRNVYFWITSAVVFMMWISVIEGIVFEKAGFFS